MKDPQGDIGSIKKILLLILVSAAIFSAIAPLWCYYKIYIPWKAALEEKGKISDKYLVKSFQFTDKDALKEWEEKVFKGRVKYNIEKGDGFNYVRAKSNASASALYYQVKLNARTAFPVMSWKWRVEKLPTKNQKETLDKQEEDDFAARVYVIFLTKFILNSKVLEYVWTESVPAGEIGTSPYSKKIKLIVLRSGLAKDKEWFSEKRDIIADYRQAFGELPEHDIGAIAFMTNTEHTGSEAEALYADINIGY